LDLSRVTREGKVCINREKGGIEERGERGGVPVLSVFGGKKKKRKRKALIQSRTRKRNGKEKKRARTFSALLEEEKNLFH